MRNDQAILGWHHVPAGPAAAVSARSAVTKGPVGAKAVAARRVPPLPAARAGKGVAAPFARAESRRQEFEDVTLPHMERLFQFARRLTRSHEEAQDVVQETY